MKSILDPSFRYVPSSRTDLKRTFARVRRMLRAAQHPEHGAVASATGQVLSIDPLQRKPSSATMTGARTSG